MTKQKKGQGSFCIPREAIKLLLSRSDAKWLIPAYLKIASHTYKGSFFSTAGHTSVKNTLKTNNNKASKLVNELCEMGLIKTLDRAPAVQIHMIYPDFDKLPEKQKPRYIIESFGETQESMVWFSRGLTDGIGEFNNPLRTLKECGDSSCKLLIHLHSQFDTNINASDPLMTCYTKYTPTGGQQNNTHIIKEWERQNVCFTPDMMLHVFEEHSTWEDEDINSNWRTKNIHKEAYNNLVAYGFIFELIAVTSAVIKSKETLIDFEHDYDGESHAECTTVWEYTDIEEISIVYELDTRSKHSQSKSALHEEIKETFRELTCAETTPGNAYSILPTGANHSVIGLIKPRFTPCNPKNAYVIDRINNQKEDLKKATNWLRHFKDQCKTGNKAA